MPSKQTPPALCREPVQGSGHRDSLGPATQPAGSHFSVRDFVLNGWVLLGGRRLLRLAVWAHSRPSAGSDSASAVEVPSGGGGRGALANRGCFESPPDLTRFALWKTNPPVKRSGGWDLCVHITKGSDGAVSRPAVLTAIPGLVATLGLPSDRAHCPPLSGGPQERAPAGGRGGLSLCQAVAEAAQTTPTETPLTRPPQLTVWFSKP